MARTPRYQGAGSSQVNPTRLVSALDALTERGLDLPFRHFSSGMQVRLGFSVITQLDEPILLVDEVLAGFRCSAAGYWGVLDRDGEHFVPDLFTFGKVVGGGMPLAALGGRAEVMDLLAPTGPVYQAGTLSGNPLATIAGLTTLQLADAGVYTRLDTRSEQWRGALHEALDRAGVPHQRATPVRRRDAMSDSSSPAQAT